MANYIAENKPEIKLVWLTKKGTDISLLNKKISVIEMGTEEAKKALLIAGVVVMNQGLVDLFGDGFCMDCSGALMVNLWHGVPWKKIGIDSLETNNPIRRLYGRYFQKITAADVYLALSEDFATILKKKCGAKEKGLIRSGYPRNSVFYKQSDLYAAKKTVLEKVKNTVSGIDGEVKIITYMPTFRDKNSFSFSFNNTENMQELNALLEKHNAIIIEKAHFVSNERGGKDGKIKCNRIVNMNNIQATTLLAATDILITDYSSCFFDFLVLDRPIIHFIYDYEYYANKDRGLYYKKEDIVCGDAPETQSDLLDALKLNLENPQVRKELRKKRAAEFITFENPDSCEEIFSEINKMI